MRSRSATEPCSLRQLIKILCPSCARGSGILIRKLCLCLRLDLHFLLEEIIFKAIHCISIQTFLSPPAFSRFQNKTVIFATHAGCVCVCVCVCVFVCLSVCLFVCVCWPRNLTTSCCGTIVLLVLVSLSRPVQPDQCNQVSTTGVSGIQPDKQDPTGNSVPLAWLHQSSSTGFVLLVCFHRSSSAGPVPLVQFCVSDCSTTLGPVPGSVSSFVGLDLVPRVKVQ